MVGVRGGWCSGVLRRLELEMGGEVGGRGVGICVCYGL